MAQRDGVTDGWILYEAWCKRNGGTPFRGRSGGAHICLVGPIDQTIDPGDDGTVDLTVPGSGKLDEIDLAKLDLQLRAVELRREAVDLDLKRTTEVINALRGAKKG